MELMGILASHLDLLQWRTLFITIIVVLLLYLYYTSSFSFFEKRNIQFKKPTIFIGNLGPRLRAKISIHDFHNEIYNCFKEHKFGGVFEGRRPILYICDPELVKAVTIRDFDHFVDRNSINRKEKYLGQSLLNLQGSEWKGVRSTVSPAFSSARLKNMLPLVKSCCTQMVEYLIKYDGNDIEMKDALGHFTLDVIGACAFGIKCDSLTGENKNFIKAAEKFNYMSKWKRIYIFFILMFMPKLFRVLNVSFLHRESIEELVRILKAAKAERRSSGDKRNDFLQLLIDASDKNCLGNGDINNSIKFDDETIDAQSLLFLLGGYETSSSLLAFAVHELAINPEIQVKLRAHINENIEGTDVTYEMLSQLHYLEAYLMETLRMYPPLSRIDRLCTKKYTLPGTQVQINEGETVSIPAYGIHMDSNIYPEPKKFKPERFMGEEKSNRPSYLFLGFGAGPRNCIGQRFAIFSTKMAMVTLVKNFEFTACSKTQNPIRFDKRSILIKSEKGVWVRVRKL